VKLKAPIYGFQAVENGEPKGKIHLVHTRRSSGIVVITVCKRFIYLDGNEKDRQIKLSRAAVGDVCQRCLGPCEALP